MFMAMNEADESGIILKTFRFEEEHEDGLRSLTVSVPEVLDPDYGMYVWPGAVVLAQYVWMQKEVVQGKNVLELGAGVSLPGTVAAKCGANVVLSDSDELPHCLDNCRRTCKSNQLHSVPVVGITWGQASPHLLLLSAVDIILGSDVFYEPEDFENVLVAVSFLLRRNAQAQFWTTYQERSANWSIEALLHKWNLTCTEVPLDGFHADKEHLAGSTLPGNHTIQMLIIQLKEKE